MPEPSQNPCPAEQSARLYRGVFFTTLLGGTLFAVSQPPWGPFAVAGWLAPACWLLLALDERPISRSGYLKILLASSLTWLAVIHWLRLPHPATFLGWIAGSCYLGLYLPIHIAFCRLSVRRFGVPIVIAAPVAWVGLEWVRAHLLTGFLMASVAHSQIKLLSLIQIVDLAGEYAVSFIVLIIAATLAHVVEILASVRTRKRLRESLRDSQAGDEVTGVRFGEPDRLGLQIARALLPAIVVVSGTLAYGFWRLNQDTKQPGPTLALIQGNALADWKSNEEKERQIMQEYTNLSAAAVQAALGRVDDLSQSAVDLVIWPETMFRVPLITFADDFEESTERPIDRAEWTAAGPREINRLTAYLGTPVLLGVDVREYESVPAEGPPKSRGWNAAVLAQPGEGVVDRYAKRHLVMFGEYIPLVEWLPSLADITPVAARITPGEEAVAFEVDGVRYAPNICYESVLPHVIRNQIVELTATGEAPDVLINLTNDAWYWGSSELDMHLASDVFRAIEMRTPLVIAANGGLSGHIDSDGNIIQVSERQTPQFLLADVQFDSRTSPYLQIGDWPAITCFLLTLLAGIAGLVGSPPRHRGHTEEAHCGREEKRKAENVKLNDE